MVLIEAIHGRIADMKMIWRRQRMDVDTQVRYYANGMLEDYYRKYRKEEFDTDLESLGEESEWDSEDEWTSEDGGEREDVADDANTSNVPEQTTDRSIPVDGYNTVPRQMGPPRGNTYDRQRSLGQNQGQQSPDSASYHEGGGYRDVAHNYGEAEEEAVDEIEDEAGQPDGDDEEAQEEEEADPAALEEEQEYPGDEPHEDDGEEEQGYGGHVDEDDEVGEPVEQGEPEGEGENEDEDDGGYNHPAPPRRRWRW